MSQKIVRVETLSAGGNTAPREKFLTDSIENLQRQIIEKGQQQGQMQAERVTLLQIIEQMKQTQTAMLDGEAAAALQRTIVPYEEKLIEANQTIALLKEQIQRRQEEFEEAKADLSRITIEKQSLSETLSSFQG